jgi:hypothetical protein
MDANAVYLPANLYCLNKNKLHMDYTTYGMNCPMELFDFEPMRGTAGKFASRCISCHSSLYWSYANGGMLHLQYK